MSTYAELALSGNLSNRFDSSQNEPYTQSEVSTDAEVSTLKSSLVGVVNHGSTASTAKPTGYGAVYWIGTVQPTNAEAGDVWIDVS